MNIGFKIPKNVNEIMKMRKNYLKKILPKIHNSLLDAPGVGSEP